MPRVTSTYTTVDCPCKGQRWDTTPCLCDCHYRSGNVCGDMDKIAFPQRKRRTRQRDWR